MGIKRMIARRIEEKRRGNFRKNETQDHSALQSRHLLAVPETENKTMSTRRKRRRARLRQIAQGLSRRSRKTKSFAQKVEKTFVPLLPSNEATLETVAERMGLSRQTIYRKLQAEGTSFTELLEAKRRKLAIRYLCREQAPLKQVAWRLGFSSPEAFSRAFKRWTGSSPGHFRSLDL